MTTDVVRENGRELRVTPKRVKEKFQRLARNEPVMEPVSQPVMTPVKKVVGQMGQKGDVVSGQKVKGKVEKGKRKRPFTTNKRIEIDAVTLKDGSEALYWRWRWREANGKRRSSYGGRIDTLDNKERLNQYRRNRRKYQNRRKGD